MQRYRSNSSSMSNNNKPKSPPTHPTSPASSTRGGSSTTATPRGGDRRRGSSVVTKIVAPGDDNNTSKNQGLHLPPILVGKNRNNNQNDNNYSDEQQQHSPTTTNHESDEVVFGFIERSPARMEPRKNFNSGSGGDKHQTTNNNENKSNNNKGRNLRTDSIFNGFRSGVLNINNDDANGIGGKSSSSSPRSPRSNNASNNNSNYVSSSTALWDTHGNNKNSTSGSSVAHKNRMMSMIRSKNDPYEQVLYHVEEMIYYIENGACPAAKKVPEKFVSAVNEAREKELWSYPTGRVRDISGNKRYTRVTLPDGSHALGHEADEPALVPQFPVSVPIENNVLTQYNHPMLVALRENNQFAKKKKGPPKKLPGAEYMPPDIGYGNMNWDGVLRSVCLAQLNIGTTSCKRVARAMILNHTVLTLDLSECAMGNEGCIELCSCLARNETLKVLNISGNNLTGEACAEPLAELIKSPRSKIITLFAACNDLGNTTAISIANVLCDAHNLEFLNLRGNSIDDVGASALLAAAAPSNNSKLTALWLQLNLISDEMMKSIGALMEQKCPPEILRALAPKKKKKKGK